VTGRSLDEWIGKTPDTKPPPRVRLRVFERYKGRCYLSGRLIRPGDKWELEHVLALALGGENREANLAPALVAAHREKTREDVGRKAKADRIRAKHLGLKTPGRGWNRNLKKKLNGEVVPR
jgi:5-methylcytosine-specific restriction endonuclease McrA